MMAQNSSDMSAGVVNVDFLRSGRAFVADSPTRMPESRERSHSMNEKLVRYHDETLSAVDSAISHEMVTRDFKISKSTPLTIVNVPFLCSGGEFKDTKPRESSGRGRSRSMNEKLSEFHDRTLAAAARASLRRSPEVVLNLGYLTSGRQLATDTAPTSSPLTRRTSAALAPTADAAATTTATSANKRLDEYYERTAAAMAEAVRAGALAGLR